MTRPMARLPLAINRAEAIKQVQRHFVSLYEGNSEAALQLRRNYAFPVYGQLTQGDAEKLAAFYFWTAWGATTNRPGQDITYTSNWPHEPLVGNTPPPSLLMWSLASVILLLGAAGALIAYYAKQFDVWREEILPEEGMARRRFDRHRSHHTFDAGDGQIFLGGLRAVSCTGRCSVSSPLITRLKDRDFTVCHLRNTCLMP